MSSAGSFHDCAAPQPQPEDEGLLTEAEVQALRTAAGGDLQHPPDYHGTRTRDSYLRLNLRRPLTDIPIDGAFGRALGAGLIDVIDDRLPPPSRAAVRAAASRERRKAQALGFVVDMSVMTPLLIAARAYSVSLRNSWP